MKHKIFKCVKILKFGTHNKKTLYISFIQVVGLTTTTATAGMGSITDECQ